MLPFFDPPVIRQYRRYRKVGRALGSKMISACLTRSVLEEAALMLGVWSKGAIVVDDEDDFCAIMEFGLYEIRDADGKSAVQRYAEEPGGASQIESELLAAMVLARPGLFKVKQVLPGSRQVLLEDLRNPGSEVVITDINMSQTVKAGWVFFLRPICLSTFTMTSGVAFVLPNRSERGLMRRWNKINNDAERFAWCFKNSKQSNVRLMYENV